MNVPAELVSRDQWVTWRYEKDGRAVSRDTDGATKIPYNARTGHKASSTNPNTWTSYDAAVKAAQQRQHSGVGFVFSKDDPFTGIDLDDCLLPDGTLEEWAGEIVTTMDSYTEISPSGSGVKIWVIGEIPSAVKTPKIEMYCSARYFTVTGQRYDNTPTTIRNVNGALTKLYEQFKVESAPAPQMAPRASIGNEHAQEWARKILARAIQMVTLAADGLKHDTLLDAARLAAGAVPHISEWDIENALYAAIDSRAEDKRGARRTIQDGIRMGTAAPLEVPPAPPQPVFDSENFACCPAHQRRLSPSKNGNGYKCRERDASTASGWCDFWWKGEGYIEPKAARNEPDVVAGEVIRSPDSKYHFQLYSLDDMRGLPPITWLIPNEVPAGLFSVLCGASEAGKSFLSVHYAMTIARAHPDRLVVYVAPEGGSGYIKRCEAWLAEHGGEQPTNLRFILRSVPMLDMSAIDVLIATIRPFDPILTILDTLARAIVGGEENSAKDIGLFVEGCDEIRRRTGSAVLAVHHTNRSGGYRGSSALFGACDSWIDFANDDGLITVSCGKAKDWKPFDPRYLRMVERADSVVLMPAEQVSQRGAALTDGQRRVLETLALDVFQTAGAKATQIMGSTGIPEKTLFRILSRLKRDGMIDQGNRGDPYTIMHRGLNEIKSYHRALRESRENELSHQVSDKDAELSLTVTQLSPPIDSTVTTVTLPLKGERVTVNSDSQVTAADDSELFPDDPQDTETLPDVTEAPPTPPKAAGGLDWVYLRGRYATGDETAIRRHCAINRQDYEMVMEQLKVTE